MDNFIISLGLKTLRKMEESKLLKEGYTKEDYRNMASTYYWAFDIDLKVDIKKMIELHNNIDGEMQASHLSKLNNLISNGITEIIISRKPEYSLGSGWFRVCLVK